MTAEKVISTGKDNNFVVITKHMYPIVNFLFYNGPYHQSRNCTRTDAHIATFLFKSVSEKGPARIQTSHI